MKSYTVHEYVEYIRDNNTGNSVTDTTSHTKSVPTTDSDNPVNLETTHLKCIDNTLPSTVTRETPSSDTTTNTKAATKLCHM